MQKTIRVILAGLVAVCALFLVYSNHFRNPFELDDAHTIVNNQGIRQLSIGEFFRDPRTFSSLPANQAYRPGLTTLNAIDYAMWSKNPGEIPNPLWFHVSIFVTFVLLGFLLFFFYRKIFELSFPGGKWNNVLSLFAAAFFSFHTANAETVNYIIARADSFSTLMVIVAFLMYMNKPAWRKTHWFLLPVIAGFFVKEPAIMFAPLLFLFIYLFEANGAIRLPDLFSSKFRKPFLYALPGVLLGIALFLFARSKTLATWSSGAEDIHPFHYFLTNFFSVVHYLNNFLFARNLAVDTDWTIIKNPFDDKVIAGFVIIILLFWLSAKTSLRKETKPIAFGILWFFITLIPTSTFFPFAEPINDHRPFFGYIGLVLAVTAFFANFIYQPSVIKTRISKTALAIAGVCLIAAHGYGVYQRNKIWSDEELLWKDTAEKCPNSGRIWMNLGLAQMKKMKYQEALANFIRSKEKWPHYPYVYINMGILKQEMGMAKEGNADFETGILYGPLVPDGYYYYGKYLFRQNNLVKADSICDLGLKLSPYSADLLGLKKSIVEAKKNVAASEPVTVPAMLEKVKQNPSADNWLNLSLAFYKAGDYRACIDAANQVLKINPGSDLAYNNICAAYNQLGEWDNAVAAGQKGLRINPANQLLAGNLSVALENQKKNK